MFCSAEGGVNVPLKIWVELCIDKFVWAHRGACLSKDFRGSD